MGASVLHRRRRQRLPGLLGREVRRPVGRDRSGAHGPEGWVGLQTVVVESAVLDEVPSGIEAAVLDEMTNGVESAVRGVASADGREASGAFTLDDLIAGAWEELSVCEVVRCPACGGQMTFFGGGTASHADAPDGAPHGDCVDCGTQLY